MDRGAGYDVLWLYSSWRRWAEVGRFVGRNLLGDEEGVNYCMDWEVEMCWSKANEQVPGCYLIDGNVKNQRSEKSKIFHSAPQVAS